MEVMGRMGWGTVLIRRPVRRNEQPKVFLVLLGVEECMLPKASYG